MTTTKSIQLSVVVVGFFGISFSLCIYRTGGTRWECAMQREREEGKSAKEMTHTQAGGVITLQIWYFFFSFILRNFFFTSHLIVNVDDFFFVVVIVF